MVSWNAHVDYLFLGASLLIGHFISFRLLPNIERWNLYYFFLFCRVYFKITQEALIL